MNTYVTDLDRRTCLVWSCSWIQIEIVLFAVQLQQRRQQQQQQYKNLSNSHVIRLPLNRLLVSLSLSYSVLLSVSIVLTLESGILSYCSTPEFT